MFSRVKGEKSPEQEKRRIGYKPSTEYGADNEGRKKRYKRDGR